MTKYLGILSVLLVALLLAGCGAARQSVPPTERSAQVTPSAAIPVDLERSDEQGAVSVVVTPLNLDKPGQTLDFEVSMNTHSVDLSMDLATLATLTTDTGLTVQAKAWDGPRSGHHVSGTLSFPMSGDSASVLMSATELTLTLRDVDAPEREFEWELAK